MLRIIFTLSMASLLSLAGCVKNQSAPVPSTPQVNKTSAPAQANNTDALSAAKDPDGDGDDKGYSYFPMHRDTAGKQLFVVDLNEGAWAAYNAQGDRVNVGRASGGRSYCPDINRSCRTAVGSYKIIRKGGADCESNKYPIDTGGGAPMPYCMYFSGKGYAVHGSNDVPNYNASHGCVRVTPTAAAWLSKNFMKIGTEVIVLPYS